MEAPITSSSNKENLAVFTIPEPKCLASKAVLFVIDEIKRIDPENLERYSVYFEEGEQSGYVNINTTDAATIEKISSISFGISIREDLDYGKKAVLALNGLFINKKYENIGSRILETMQTAMRSLVGLEQLNCGFIELYSVETAVLFYIKNGFIVRDLFSKNLPQTKAQATHKILHFALKENNIEIVKKYAKVNPDNFLDFVE
ncbi:MAG TPA: hypothetical protein DGG95_08190 [Cytophagales bacterium]|jgi:hypothetical protein|nr:hypothetical protein [Cytophagales bacterium]